MRYVLILLLTIIATFPAYAQQPVKPPERIAFDRLSEQLLGSWTCSIREFEESGAVKWSDEQVRVFSRSFRGNGLEERAYKAPRLEVADNFGLHVMLLQRPGYKVTQYGIWPGGAARLFTMDGTLRPDGSGIDGTMTATDENGAQDQRRVVAQWLNAAEHAYRVYSRRADGSEYLREELIYRRKG